MKINKLTASFGKLENDTLSFRDGLNVIYAPNESGKSTWCAFIMAMLYGVDSSERARAGYLPDKLRYAPWSGAPMEGSMELTADREKITITRRTKTKSAPMREFTATYTGTNVPVKELTGSNAGEMLTGISKDVFRRSAFIPQGTVAVSGSPELEKRISAIVSTGEEETSFSEADERLRAWQRKRRYNHRGFLPELEAKMDDTQRRLEDMGGSIENVEELEKQLEQTKQSCVELERQVTDARRRQRREALDRLNAGREALRRSSEEHDAAITELSHKREELSESPFGGRDPDELEETVDRDLEELARVRAAAENRPRPLWGALLMVLAVASAALYTSLDLIVLMIFAAVFCVGAIVMLMRYGKQRRAAADAAERQNAILRKYKAQSAAEISAALTEYRHLWDSAREAEQNELRTRGAYENARVMQSRLEETALGELDFSAGDSEAAHLGRKLTAARAEAERLSRQIASINGRLAAMGDPLVLSSSLSCMQEEHELICDEYDAITMAIDTLREADTEIQSRFSPELGRVAAGYMSAVTGGRYADVLLNRDFTAKARTQNDTVARDAEYLSAGTLDIMYIAVRLAVCELALPEGEPCPLIIDDALVNLDETRLEQAMALLREIAKERQVILFTCRRPGNGDAEQQETKKERAAHEI